MQNENATSNGGASHWKSAVDAQTGRTYYYHEVTRETQWRKPMELASDAERRAMEEKERKQKDFFAAMEANMLNSISQGVVPGTPSQGGDGSGTSNSLKRRKSSRKVPLGPDGRPEELVRTISTMDETFLRDLIRRQPSFRTMKPGMSKEDSLRPEDLICSRTASFARDGFDSWSHSSHNLPLETLEESVREGNTDLHDSMPELFSYLPDEDHSVDYNEEEGDLSFRSDGGKFNESSLTGFGLTWEETQALKKLASITKEMIDAETEEFDVEQDTKESNTKDLLSVATSSPWKTNNDEKKEKRNLPREIEFDNESDDDGEVTPKQAPAFRRATEVGGGRALPRELDFEDSDEDDTKGAGQAPTSRKARVTRMLANSGKKAEDLVRPEVKRRNTCGTLYVGTTMSAPDKDATIRCVCGVFRSHILSSEHDTSYNPDTDIFKVFNDLESEQGGRSFEASSKAKASPKPPSLDEVTSFYRDTFFKAQMEADCIIMSLIYVERLIKKTIGRLRPRSNNWRSLLFSCMILSSKVWDDLSMWNVDFSQSCPPGVSFSLKRINELELAVLNTLSFKVKVPASEYAKYYFLLRSMLIKSGLSGEDLGSLNPLDVQGAVRLQQVSSQFESMSLTRSDALDSNHRSKSLEVGNVLGNPHDHASKPKMGLEQIVKM